MVAYTSAGRGQGSDRSEIFFTKQLPPYKAVENIATEREPESITVSWTPLTPCEARGFPIYSINLTLSGGRVKRQFINLNMMTTGSSVMFMGLDRNTEYSVIVGVRSQGVPGIYYKESVPVQVKKIM